MKRGESSTSEVISGVVVHTTAALCHIFGELGRIETLIPFLEKGLAEQVVTLRILKDLLKQNESNMRLFLELNGYGILLFLLSKNAHYLTLETFDILFELVSDGLVLRSKKKYIKNKECFFLILDLIPFCDFNLQKHVVQTLTDLVTMKENLSLLSSKEGGVTVFNMILHSFSSLNETHPLLPILRKISGTISPEDIETLFDFLISDTETHIDPKIDLLQFLYDELQNSPQILEYMMKANGFYILFSLMDSGHEHFRVLSIKLLGLFLHSNPKNQSFSKMSGYETTAQLISKHPITNLIAETLLQFSLG